MNTTPAASVPVEAPSEHRRILLSGDRSLRGIWVRTRLPQARPAIEVTELDEETLDRLDRQSGGLFRDPRPLIVHCDAPVAVVATLLSRLSSFDGTVVVSVPRAPAKIHAFESVTVRAPKDRRGWQDIGREFGLTLDASSADLLHRWATKDVTRSVSVLELCRLGRLHRPSVAQLEQLVVTGDDDVTPWTVGDHVENGRATEALTLCEDVVPLALHAYLSRRWIRALELGEGSEPVDQREQRLAQLSRRVGMERLRKAIALLAEHDMLLKQYGHDGLRLLICRAAPLFR